MRKYIQLMVVGILAMVFVGQSWGADREQFTVNELSIGNPLVKITATGTELNQAGTMAADIAVMKTNAIATSRLSGTVANAVNGGNVTIAANKDLIAVTDNGATTNVLASNGLIDMTKGAADVAVADGGTGVSTLTDGGILLGSGTSAITPMAVLASGEIVIGDGTTDPVAYAAFTGPTGDLKVPVTLPNTAKITTTPVANVNVTNAQAVTLAGVINLLTGTGSANAGTNTITLANPSAAGQWAILYNAAAATNLLAIAKTGNFDGPALQLGAGESAIIFAPSASKWAGIGQ